MNAPAPMVNTPLGRTISSMPEHPAKTFVLMFSMAAGNTRVPVIPLQPLKALSPKLTRLLGIFSGPVSFVPLKAFAPMVVMLFGRLIVVRLLHSLKASSPMDVTPSGRLTVVRLSQSQKALLPMVFRPLAIWTRSNESKSIKASSPMVPTLPVIRTSCKASHS